MGFDLSTFRNARFLPREGEVRVPGLKDFFGPGEDPAFKVRGLTAFELGRANQLAEADRNTGAILDALASKTARDIVDGIKAALGLDETQKPEATVRMIAFVEMGTVDPKLSQEDAVRLARAYPIEFTQLGKEIIRLTGLGAVDANKKKDSGTTPRSGEPLPLVIVSGDPSSNSGPISSPKED